ncbi:MAG: sigma-70 family RNA polymerase sigma factor [Myxococcaceae bacterium]|nr:sigma-70 family RNA polymerase sigma factor [Myxococcaceae bacterium]
MREAFLDEAGTAWRGVADLDDRLRRALEAARAAFPGVAFDAERSARTLGRAARGASFDSLDALPPDVLLAAAALSGDSGAVGVVDRWIVSEARHAAQHLRAGPALADELAQQVRQRVLSPPTPKLADYTGKGSLKKWLRAAATRLGINLVSYEGRHRAGDGDDDAALGQLQASAASPELAMLKAEAAQHFQQALRSGFSTLSPKERNLLRLYFLDGVSSAQLAQTYGTHRVTVTRWLASARAAVVDAAVAELRARGVLSTASLGDLHLLVRSQLGDGWAEALRDE